MSACVSLCRMTSIAVALAELSQAVSEIVHQILQRSVSLIQFGQCYCQLAEARVPKDKGQVQRVTYCLEWGACRAPCGEIGQWRLRRTIERIAVMNTSCR